MRKIDRELKGSVQKNLGDLGLSEAGSITNEYGNFVDEYAYASGDPHGIGTKCVNCIPQYTEAGYAILKATKKGRSKIAENIEICKANCTPTSVTSAQATLASQNATLMIATTKPKPVKEKDLSVSIQTGDSKDSKSKTGLYVGIGVGVLVVGVIGYFVFRKK